MAWMSDEQYELMQDTKDKAITARSARHTRTHCGKGGAVKFPSDNLTKKERESMNGECKSYRLNDPMTYEQFKAMPKDLQVCYIKAIRSKYKTPDNILAQAMGIRREAFGKHIRELKLGLGKGAAAAGRTWPGTVEANQFNEWWYGKCEEAPQEPENEPDEQGTDELIAVNENADIIVNEDTDVASLEDGVRQASEILKRDMFGGSNEMDELKPIEPYSETHFAVPTRGEMSFQGNPDDILRTVRNLLDGRDVWMKVEWIVNGD